MITKHSYAVIVIGSGGGIGLSLKQAVSLQKDYSQLFCYSKSHNRIKAISNLKIEDSENFVDYQGKIIPY
tara:strand:+ start:518 stop:727 length:210 start_codon:yes stop_codon:yes gene_type:complete